MHLPLWVTLVTLQVQTVTLEERVDLYDPVSGAYQGAETTLFGADGRRLRLVNTDADGATTLLFFLLHDEAGREAEAVYFESSPEAYREVFTYSGDGLVQTTTYFYEPGVAADRTESVREASGREVEKRYFRANGTQYGAEQVLWNADGTQLGWDFRYVEREGGASFRYRYEALDRDGAWKRRTRSKDGVPERVEVRTRKMSQTAPELSTAAPFAPGVISTDASETSPSFSRDGRTMVFARYEEWDVKRPYIAMLEGDGWRVEPLEALGDVYNLTLSPDGGTIVYATRDGELRRVRRTGGGWSPPEGLAVRGSYPSVTEDGDLLFYDADGPAGQGVYRARAGGGAWGPPEPVFVHEDGTTFDPVQVDGGLIVSRCADDVCGPSRENGLFLVGVGEGSTRKATKLKNLPYAWGAQPVEALGLFVFTDGEDILAVPLEVALLKG